MPNKPSAKEWLSHAYHDLNGAILMYEAEHYTDTISYVIHQAIEKTLKSLLAYDNIAIKKSHNLRELYELVSNESFILNDDELYILAIATTYYTKQRYPTPHKKLPDSEEIKNVIEFSKQLLSEICNNLNINMIEMEDCNFDTFV